MQLDHLLERAFRRDMALQDQVRQAEDCVLPDLDPRILQPLLDVDPGTENRLAAAGRLLLAKDGVIDDVDAGFPGDAQLGKLPRQADDVKTVILSIAGLPLPLSRSAIAARLSAFLEHEHKRAH